MLPHAYVRAVQYRVVCVGRALAVKADGYGDNLVVAYALFPGELVVAAHDVASVVAKIDYPVQDVLTVVAAVQRHVVKPQPAARFFEHDNVLAVAQHGLHACAVRRKSNRAAGFKLFTHDVDYIVKRNLFIQGHQLPLPFQ